MDAEILPCQICGKPTPITGFVSCDGCGKPVHFALCTRQECRDRDRELEETSVYKCPECMNAWAKQAAMVSSNSSNNLAGAVLGERKSVIETAPLLQFLRSVGLAITPHSDPSYGWGFTWLVFEHKGKQVGSWLGPYDTQEEAIQAAFAEARRGVLHYQTAGELPAFHPEPEFLEE